ncbi:solute carrier family 46 member 3-like [Actinia tenebrosa]|uniref:Solute carrier family 46 member 3-like n=1 Tax=Actinia tenebrosa TaxID=6105 RepID=A0A6P8HBM8_ACTTE|nr:solute carrier family 46 member 3-like [Actinia tenebrosa]
MSPRQPSTLPWLKNPRRAITVEVVIFLYIAAVLLENPIMQQYLYERARMDSPFKNDTNETVCGGPKYLNDTKRAASDVPIQQKASKYILGVNLALTLPAVVMACFLGPWSDTRGRKPLMIIVSVTASLDAAVVLITMYMKWPVYVFMIASGIGGLGGYYPTMVAALLAYAADTTSPESRAIKLGILEALAFLGGTLSQFASGFWVENLGYTATFWMILSFHVLNLLYIIFLLPESLLTPSVPKRKPCCLSFENIKPVITVYTKKRKGRWILFTLLLLSVIFLLAQFIITTLVVLYTKNSPLCWTATLIGYYLGTLLFSKAFGAVVGIWACSKLKLSNYSSAQFGTVFLIGNLVMLGFSKTTLLMFLSCIVGVFSGIPRPCLGAQLSQMIDQEEQGALFSVFASLESLCNFSSQLIFNPLYAWSIEAVHWEYAAGLPFMINAGLAIIPLVLLSVIKHYADKSTGEREPLLPKEDPVA